MINNDNYNDNDNNGDATRNSNGDVRVCCCSKFYQLKLFSGGIAAGEHSAAAIEHREEVLLLRCRGRRARSRHRRRSSTPLTRSRSSAQRPREPSLATKRRLLQSSAKEDAERIPQLRLHPRLGTKKRLGAKRSRSSARRQCRPSLATKRRLLQSSAETNALGRCHQRRRLQQNCNGMLD